MINAFSFKDRRAKKKKQFLKQNTFNTLFKWNKTKYKIFSYFKGKKGEKKLK